MSQLLLKKLNQKVSNLEKQMEKLRRSVNSRSALEVPSDPSLIKVQLGEAVPDRYTILKVVHNSSGPNTYARAIIYGSDHADNDLATFIPAISMSTGAEGDHIMAKIDGPSFASVVPVSFVAYGDSKQIMAGDLLTVEGTPGWLRKGDDQTVNHFIALESTHQSEQIIRVKFAPGDSASDGNKLFVVSITALFGGQTYDGILWELDENNVFQEVEDDISIVAIDNTDMVGTLMPGLKYLARRSQNFGTIDDPFYFYHIQPTRVE